MRIESKLSHLSENKVIVQVTGWEDGQNLGSALAEGLTVEAAEDKAISRLNKRLNLVSNVESKKVSINEDKIKNQKIELPKSGNINNTNEPTDWSNELIEIDSEIHRLKWSRDDENRFLETNLGYKKRNNITSYNDILRYLNLLKNISKPSQFEVVNKSINSLMEESDNILRDLSWDNTRGRDYLQKEFNVSTRKELNEEQLSSFVAKLKLVRNQNLTH